MLLHATVKVRRLLTLHVEVCHVDHGLRPESGEDASFVQRVCGEVGVQCHVVRLGKRPAKTNMEAWAREERYRVFRDVMRRSDLHHLVTAHTANDVAETLLMRLIANKELTTIEEHDGRRGCLRPLLGISREQIDEFVEANDIPYVEDASNQDTTMLRNRVRKKVIPLLQRDFDPSVVWSLAERAQSVASDCEALQYVADGIAGKVGPVQLGESSWLKRASQAVFPVPYALKWRVVQALFTPILGYTVGEPRARAILGLIEGGQESLDLGEGRSLSVTASGLVLR